MSDKCNSQIVFNGVEFGCQWDKNHLGCHSAWTSEVKKIKWSDFDASKAIASLEAKNRELEDLVKVALNDYTELNKVVCDPQRVKIESLEAKNRELEAEISEYVKSSYSSKVESCTQHEDFRQGCMRCIYREAVSAKNLKLQLAEKDEEIERLKNETL